MPRATGAQAREPLGVEHRLGLLGIGLHQSADDGARQLFGHAAVAAIVGMQLV